MKKDVLLFTYKGISVNVSTNFNSYCIKVLALLCFSGVDFQMKRLIVDGEPTVLQLWDTAGQERLV